MEQSSPMAIELPCCGACRKALPARCLRGQSREDPRIRRRRSARRTRSTSTWRRPGPPATPTRPRRRCSPSSTPAGRCRRDCSTPTWRSTSRAGAWLSGVRLAGPVVVAGDEITTVLSVGASPSEPGCASTCSSRIGQPARRGRLHWGLDEHHPGDRMSPGQRATLRAASHARSVCHGPLCGRVGRLQPDPHR